LGLGHFVFAQQWQLLLRLSSVASPDGRQRFILDLRQDIQTRVLKKKSACVMAIDFNEQLGGKDPNLLTSICSQFNLFDTHNFQHG
jgi:hypothetical protein